MAFDMYAGDAKESIEHHEEFIFVLATENSSRYPQLSALWDRFYDDPSLSPQQSNSLVHELIDLLTSNGGGVNKPLANLILRILPFFSRAFQGQTEVRCTSD